MQIVLLFKLFTCISKTNLISCIMHDSYFFPSLCNCRWTITWLLWRWMTQIARSTPSPLLFPLPYQLEYKLPYPQWKINWRSWWTATHRYNNIFCLVYNNIYYCIHKRSGNETTGIIFGDIIISQPYRAIG